MRVQVPYAIYRLGLRFYCYGSCIAAINHCELRRGGRPGQLMDATKVMAAGISQLPSKLIKTS